MKVYLKEYTILTKRFNEIINISEKVKETVHESGIKNGIALVFSKHTTTGVIINENEPGLEKDIPEFLRRIVDKSGEYNHHHFFYKDGRMAINAWAHLRSILVGLNVTVPVKEGEVLLGARENIYLLELDGPKERHFVVEVMGV